MKLPRMLLTGASGGLGLDLYLKFHPEYIIDCVDRTNGMDIRTFSPKQLYEVVIFNHALWTAAMYKEELLKVNLLETMRVASKVKVMPGGTMCFILTQDTPEDGIGICYKTSKAALEFFCKCLISQRKDILVKGIKVGPMKTTMWVGPYPDDAVDPSEVAEFIYQNFKHTKRSGIWRV